MSFETTSNWVSLITISWIAVRLESRPRLSWKWKPISYDYCGFLLSMYNYCHLFSPLLGTFILLFLFLSIDLPIVDSKSISTIFFTWDNYQLIILVCVVGLGKWHYVANSKLYNKKIVYLWHWSRFVNFHLNIVLFDTLGL